MKYLASFILLFYVSSLFGQYQNIIIDDEGSPHETSIMLNPGNTNQLVAGANINYYYYSEDGGYNWTKGTLVSLEYGVWGDPCIVVDTTGFFYYVHLSNPPSGTKLDRIVTQKFDFSSHTWNDGSAMGLNGNKDQDKSWAAIDHSNNNIYVTWTQFDNYGSGNPLDSSNIMFSKSVDGGETWSISKKINQVSGDCKDFDNTVEGAVPCVGPEGEIYVSWAGPEGIVFDRSLDGGDTWLSNDIFVSDQPGGWSYSIGGLSRCNGMPVTCCDISNSPFHGNIYINWTDQRNGDVDVFIAKSTDGGNTWSAPVRVNDDPPGNDQFFSWMTIDRANGDIYVIFYDRRGYYNNYTDVYIARSTDGGETFENLKISESPFFPYSSYFFGDYTNITAYNGKVRPIWTRLQNGNFSILTAIVDFTVGTQENHKPTLLPVSIQQNYPNPFKESTTLSFRLNEHSLVNLYVLDVTGRKVATLIDNEDKNSGEYIEHFNALQHGLQGGIYYFVLTTNHSFNMQKIVLVN